MKIEKMHKATEKTQLQNYELIMVPHNNIINAKLLRNVELAMGWKILTTYSSPLSHHENLRLLSVNRLRVLLCLV